MADQQALPIDVERVAKRSTSRIVRRPTGRELIAGGFDAIGAFGEALNTALDRAGVKPGESFYVARVPPRESTSHLGDLQRVPTEAARHRRQLLAAFARCGPMTAREATNAAWCEGGWRRVSELVTGGHLYPTGATREAKKGHPARVLGITDRGRAALRALA